MSPLKPKEQSRLNLLYEELTRVRNLLEYYVVERADSPGKPPPVLLMSYLQNREHDLVEEILGLQVLE